MKTLTADLAIFARGRAAALTGTLLACVFLAGCLGGIRQSPLAIESMRAAGVSTTLGYERQERGGDGFSAYLVSYQSSGLQLYALVAVPEGQPPAAGFPVLIANHGYHPDPPRYGVTAEGVDWRPGDYYRAVPEAYTREGFLVVMPDYRGHNQSEGGEYTEGLLASSYYTLDVLALVSALSDLEQADLGNVFMWGHSMGGEITLRALLATRAIRAASLWAPTGAPLWEQAYHYDDTGPGESGQLRKEQGIDRLREQIEALPFTHRPEWSDPLNHLGHLETPLIIHHARADGSVPFEWSERLAARLHLAKRPFVLYAYDVDEHIFQGEELARAVDRDAAFFRSFMVQVQN